MRILSVHPEEELSIGLFQMILRPSADATQKALEELVVESKAPEGTLEIERTGDEIALMVRKDFPNPHTRKIMYRAGERLALLGP